MEAVVLFDYEKQQDDELNLKVGETITNVTQVDDGWCEGTWQGQTGMFPDNFVQLRTATVPPPIVTSVPSASRPARAPPPDPDPPVVARATGQSTKSRRAKVAFSYAAENPDELSLQPGQLVDVLDEEEDGWWKGKVGDSVGLFPSNFVELINEEALPSDSAHPAAPLDISDGPPQQLPEKRLPPGAVARGMGLPRFNPQDIKSRLKPTPHITPAPKKEEPPLPKMPELRKSQPRPPAPPPPPPQETPVERAKVVFTYTPEQDDELEIEAGDTLDVVSKTVQDGWWKVKLDGKVGLVPDNFVELLPSQPAESLEPPPPVKKEPRKPPPAPVPQEPQDHGPDFGVPVTEPLDSSAVKERPHKPSGVRPPSRSNLHTEEGEQEAPWQRELKKRKKKEPVKPPGKPHPPPPPAAMATEPEKKPIPPRGPSRPSLAERPKPKVPATKPAVDVVKKPPPPKPADPTPAMPPSASLATPPPSAEDWREALEKLRSELAEFKDQIRREVKQQIQLLSDDLDEERKNNASLKIDIDRLKKSKM